MQSEQVNSLFSLMPHNHAFPHPTHFVTALHFLCLNIFVSLNAGRFTSDQRPRCKANKVPQASSSTVVEWGIDASDRLRKDSLGGRYGQVVILFSIQASAG